MIYRQFFRFSSACLLVFLLFMLNCAQAVELGDSLVRSHIGQPLSADIELTALAGDTASVQVALADPEVYRGAGISMHPALAALNITIIQRDGKRYVRIASPKAVESEYVHIFFDLTEDGRRAVRQVTLWLSPNPNPVPSLPPSPAPPKVATAPVTLVVAPIPPAPAKAPVLAPTAPPAAAPVLRAPVLRAALAAQPATCAPTFTAAQIGACTALDGKNAALTARIAELEGKVRVLATVHGKREPVLAAPPAAKAPAARGTAQATKLVPMGAATARQTTGPVPWLFIAIAGAIMLALAALLAFLLRRKRRGEGGQEAVKSRAGFIASVKNRLLLARKEPTLGAEAGVS